MISGDILLVGGYGHVGTILARQLATHYPGRIVVAGHREKEAQAVAATLESSARGQVWM